MELLKQCQVWHENDEFQKIVDALEKLPEEERTPETDSELARAYNNLADAHQPEGRAMIKRAIELLSPHEEYFRGDRCWNFRMGYSYYFLGQEGPALHYFQQALEARPDDQETLWFIQKCWDRLSLPQFQENFQQRTVRAWEAFAQQDAELRSALDEDRKQEGGGRLLAQCQEILQLAFEDISFELGFNGEKYELILTPEGDRLKFLELMYFSRHAPNQVLKHWNILVGCQPTQNFCMRSAGWEVSGRDVQIWVEQLGESHVGLTLYSEKLVPLLLQEGRRAWWMLSTLTDQVLGEIPAMRYIDRFDVVLEPREEPFVRLSDLPMVLMELGYDLSTDPEAYLDCYTSYKLEPNKDPDADWRMDVIVGSTCCPPLVNEYLHGEHGGMDRLHADGVVAGFLCYPLDGFSGEDSSQQIFDFRDRLETALTENDGEEALTLIGGATGLYCGYVDLIAWDLDAALKIAKAFFVKSGLPWAGFHVFYRDAGTVPLIDQEDEEQNGYEGDEAVQGESERDSAGTLAGFVLLSEASWDQEQLIHDLKEKWGIEATEEQEEQNDMLLLFVGNMIAAISLMPAPIPNHEAEMNAENNDMWPEAVAVAKAHKAHIMVAVLGQEDDLLERGKLYTKVLSACCRQKNATGVYTSGVVFEPHVYEEFADVMHENKLPIFNWIWFGLYQGERGLCGYTYGMDAFGKDEMEVLDADAAPGELRNFLAGVASYVLESDVELHDGETIGCSADEQYTMTRSEGVALPGVTLKIAYQPSENGPAMDDLEEEQDGLEVYTQEEIDALEDHIERYFGSFESVFHERRSLDIHVDIYLIPPTEVRDYYTLVTMGMGAHQMHVPEELADYQLERAELVIALPADWKLDVDSLGDERWYWPIRLLKGLARFPGQCDDWLGFGHTVHNRGPFAENTDLRASILIAPQRIDDDGEICVLPNGENVNFYQVIPLYQEELDYKIHHDASELLEKMSHVSFVVQPNRPNAIP